MKQIYSYKIFQQRILYRSEIPEENKILDAYKEKYCNS